MVYMALVNLMQVIFKFKSFLPDIMQHIMLEGVFPLKMKHVNACSYYVEILQILSWPELACLELLVHAFLSEMSKFYKHNSATEQSSPAQTMLVISTYQYLG